MSITVDSGEIKFTIQERMRATEWYFKQVAKFIEDAKNFYIKFLNLPKSEQQKIRATMRLFEE